MLVLLGSLGVGAVWGWLLGMLSWPALRWVRRLLAVAAATALVGGLVFLLAGWLELCLFLACAGLALASHVMWRRVLFLRFGPKHVQGGVT